MKKHFVVALKSNRKAALSEQGKKQGQYTKVEELGLHTGQCLEVWLTDGFSSPYQTGLYKQRLPTAELFLISNDPGLGAADLIAIYEKRWCVEVFHKSLKQNAGLEKSPTKYEVTQSNHIFAR
ncbi:MAG: hypothetical protein R2825_02505 [Saprospiraceae bacterium]